MRVRGGHMGTFFVNLWNPIRLQHGRHRIWNHTIIKTIIGAFACDIQLVGHHTILSRKTTGLGICITQAH